MKIEEFNKIKKIVNEIAGCEYYLKQLDKSIEYLNEALSDDKKIELNISVIVNDCNHIDNKNLNQLYFESSGAEQCIDLFKKEKDKIILKRTAAEKKLEAI